MSFEALARRHSTPRQVQKFLRSMPYNREENGDTLRSALSAWRCRTIHCLEGAMLAAAILEQRGYEPLVMSLESADELDHVVFVFETASGWGSIGRSRLEGLHGRAPRFRSLRDLALSYYDPFIDATGRVTGYAVGNLDDSRSRWRDSRKNVWAVEQYLISLVHTPLKVGRRRYLKWFDHYKKTGQSGSPMPFWW